MIYRVPCVARMLPNPPQSPKTPSPGPTRRPYSARPANAKTRAPPGRRPSETGVLGYKHYGGEGEWARLHVAEAS